MWIICQRQNMDNCKQKMVGFFLEASIEPCRPNSWTLGAKSLLCWDKRSGNFSIWGLNGPRFYARGKKTYPQIQYKDSSLDPFAEYATLNKFLGNHLRILTISDNGNLQNYREMDICMQWISYTVRLASAGLSRPSERRCPFYPFPYYSYVCVCRLYLPVQS